MPTREESRRVCLDRGCERNETVDRRLVSIRDGSARRDVIRHLSLYLCGQRDPPRNGDGDGAARRKNRAPSVKSESRSEAKSWQFSVSY